MLCRSAVYIGVVLLPRLWLGTKSFLELCIGDGKMYFSLGCLSHEVVLPGLIWISLHDFQLVWYVFSCLQSFSPSPVLFWLKARTWLHRLFFHPLIPLVCLSPALQTFVRPYIVISGNLPFAISFHFAKQDEEGDATATWWMLQVGKFRWQTSVPNLLSQNHSLVSWAGEVASSWCRGNFVIAAGLSMALTCLHVKQICKHCLADELQELKMTGTPIRSKTGFQVAICFWQVKLSPDWGWVGSHCFPLCCKLAWAGR